MTKAAHAAGLILIANVGLADYPATQNWWTLWNSIADGAMEESWTFGTDANPVSLMQWKTELANVQFNETHGKYTLLNADTFGNHSSDVYALASMLLVAAGRTSYDAADGNYHDGEYWWPEYSASQHLGPALGTYTALRDQLYIRRFAHGTVVVNPNTASIADPTFGVVAAHTGQINLAVGH